MLIGLVLHGFFGVSEDGMSYVNLKLEFLIYRLILLGRGLKRHLAKVTVKECCWKVL